MSPPMTDTPRPPTKMRLLKAFSVTASYGQIWLDIGEIRYFIYPEMALAMAEALQLNVAIIRPPIPQNDQPEPEEPER